MIEDIYIKYLNYINEHRKNVEEAWQKKVNPKL